MNIYGNFLYNYVSYKNTLFLNLHYFNTSKNLKGNS